MRYSFHTMAKQDAEAVLGVFNYFVKNSYAAYGEQPEGHAKFTRYMELTKDYPSIVAETENGTTVGFAFLHAFHPAATLNHTAEIVYFILPEHTRQGLGSLMLSQLIADARQRGVEAIIAQISSLNEQSMCFHIKHGFTECGRLPGIGRKWGKDFDVIWMYRSIKRTSADHAEI